MVHKMANLQSSRKRINYMGLKEPVKHDYDFFMAFVCFVFVPLMFYFVNIRNSFPFSLELSKTHRDLADSCFVNRNETFILFSLPDPSRILKLLLCILIFRARQLFI